MSLALYNAGPPEGIPPGLHFFPFHLYPVIYILCYAWVLFESIDQRATSEAFFCVYWQKDITIQCPFHKTPSGKFCFITQWWEKSLSHFKEGRIRREGTYVYLWLIHVDICQKVTKFCKAIILQLKNK